MVNGPFYKYISWPSELTSVFSLPGTNLKARPIKTKNYGNAANRAGEFTWEWVCLYLRAEGSTAKSDGFFQSHVNKLKSATGMWGNLPTVIFLLALGKQKYLIKSFSRLWCLTLPSLMREKHVQIPKVGCNWKWLWAVRLYEETHKIISGRTLQCWKLKDPRQKASWLGSAYFNMTRRYRDANTL